MHICSHDSIIYRFVKTVKGPVHMGLNCTLRGHHVPTMHHYTEGFRIQDSMLNYNMLSQKCQADGPHACNNRGCVARAGGVLLSTGCVRFNKGVVGHMNPGSFGLSFLHFAQALLFPLCCIIKPVLVELVNFLRSFT